MAKACINALNASGVTARLLDAPADVSTLAQHSGLPADKLARILDFLAAHEVIGHDGGGVYRATARTTLAWDRRASLQIGYYSTCAGTRLLDALRGGGTPFEHYFGAGVFPYLSARPDEGALFGAFMADMTRRIEAFLFAQHAFHPFATVADIGGSMGDLLLAVLDHYPDTHGILFDLPPVIEGAAPRVASSVHADRVELVGGSFFDSVPAADLYLMKQILHDWDDAEAAQILATVRRAMPHGARLAVVDHILSDPPAPDEAQSTDIAMMLWDTGRERKLGEFAALFAATGFAIDRVTRNPNGHSVIEVVPI
jgi:hypothetical protein